MTKFYIVPLNLAHSVIAIIAHHDAIAYQARADTPSPDRTILANPKTTSLQSLISGNILPENIHILI